MAALRLRSKRVGWLKAALAIAFLNLVVGTGLYLTSAGFEDDMRRLLIGQLEQTTGGKTELKEFHWNLSRLELEGRAIGPFGKEVMAFEAKTSLNRKDYGLKWNVALETGGMLVGETVKIEIQVEVVKQ